MEAPLCQQKGCTKRALFRYTWPGEHESYVCMPHAKMIDNIADAMGLHVQLIPLPVSEFVAVAEAQMEAVKEDRSDEVETRS
jgi:hypothetical protein